MKKTRQLITKKKSKVAQGKLLGSVLNKIYIVTIKNIICVFNQIWGYNYILKWRK